MSPRNRADCVGHDAVLSSEIIAGLLAQFDLTPKSKHGLTAKDAVDSPDGV